jgi:hypothetical protein
VLAHHAPTPCASQAPSRPRPRLYRDRACQARLVDQFRQQPRQDAKQRCFARAHQVPRTTLQRWLHRPPPAQVTQQEVAFFESAVGVAVLHRLQVAAHLVMSLMGACGIRLVCQLFRSAGLDRFIACSYGAQQQVAQRMEQQVVRFGQKEQQRLGETMPPRTVSLVEDETFHQKPCLVAIEPVSNFIVLERYAPQRDAATWTQYLKQALGGLPIQVVQVTSDEGKGLLRHTKTELGVHHSPDLFHVQYEISGGTAAPLATRVRAAQAGVDQASEGLQQVLLQQQEAAQRPRGPGRPVDFAAKIEAAQQSLGQAQQQMDTAVAQQQAMQHRVRQMATVYHPFDLQTGVAKTADQVATDLGSLMDKARNGAQQAGLSQASQQRIEKAARVVPALVATIAFFHGLVAQRVAALGLCSELSRLVHQILIPALYLQRVAKATPGAAARAALRGVAQALLDTLRAAPPAWSALPAATRTSIGSLAQECADLFQRASSCVEGRNGQLALRHHHLHRISAQRLGALTVIHNYVVQRADGTTAAQRFFGARPKDLFTQLCLVLPLPARPRSRRRRKEDPVQAD